MPFEYPDTVEVKTKKEKVPKQITRKIKFEIKPLTNEGWLIVTAEKLAIKYGGYVVNYKIRSCIDMSYIKFKCPEENWLRLHCEFLGETNGRIDKVRCSRL